MKEMFEAMLKHMAWADRRIGEALAAFSGDAAGGGAADPRHAEADAETTALLAEAVRLYAHIVAAETVWLARLAGDESLLAPVWPAWNAAETRAKSEEVLGRYERFLADCSDFRQTVSYRTSAGVPYATSAADILTHVFLHGSYHRGQINARLRGAGREPVNVDYITFVR